MTVAESLGRYRVEIEAGGYCRFNVQLTNSRHRHPYYELCLALDGHGTYDHGGQRIQLEAGDVFVARPGVVHEISSYETRNLHLYFVSLGLAVQPAGAGTAESDLIAAFENSSAVRARGCEDLAAFLPLIREETQGVRRRASREALKLLTLSMMEALATVSLEVGESPEPGDPVDRALEFIGANLHRRLTVDEIAEVVGLSARSLRRGFQRRFGVAVADEVNRRRMRFASHQLLMGFSVGEVSAMVGIQDAAQFSRAFSRSFGIPPKRFQLDYRPGRPSSQTWPA